MAAVAGTLPGPAGARGEGANGHGQFDVKRGQAGAEDSGGKPEIGSDQGEKRLEQALFCGKSGTGVQGREPLFIGMGQDLAVDFRGQGGRSGEVDPKARRRLVGQHGGERRARVMGDRSGPIWRVDSRRPPGGAHSMLIVGYDLEGEYWIVRNSWGEGWGDGGYFRIPFQTLEAYAVPEHFWVIGAISQKSGLRVVGPSMAQSAATITQNAPDQMRARLQKLRQSLRSDIKDRLDTSRRDFRSRLRGE